VRIYDAYTKQTVTQTLEPGGVLIWHWSLENSFGWYDLSISVESDAGFLQQLAGHVETGHNSVSDPALGV
jgi:phospholipase C